MARVCVVGSVNMDLSLRVDALPRPGETVLATSLTHAPGGKGGNQAVAAARAGARVQFVGAVGDDPAAEQLRAHLLDNGVGLDATAETPGPSGTAIVVVDGDAENTIVVAPGANGRLTLDAEAVRGVIAGCDVLLTQLEIPVRAAVAAAQQARSAGAVVIVNASPAGQDQSSLADLAAAADVVIANEAEADAWPWRPTHLVTTLGARGARYVGADGDFVVPAPAVAAVDTAGAGDVFAGVLAGSWPRNPGSPAQRLRALRRACAAGALATLVPGAGNCAPDAEAIDAALESPA
ncbi:PfkB family carbohydrate kinase [Mycobacterium nebraskense]|uniref:Ribokinase n=2 Tax=Mycobacterium nebraskense TaxID=244292 RepID=A0A1X1Z0V3_9MYCO|nr:PfkB family carbohydrate kinase [Mycobacterium nebraskense]KLO40223.1 ribokinase [Mycobacterium nebraskense]MBI2692907.1 ribokinase [Mycobacterium nebraskense]MCV7117641.1 ribokinase [Mycobacterium nebraskense]ORW16904.1 ribokinase [Mycobacterium nebraskense]